MNDDDLSRLIPVRMSILLGRTAMRRPTRMPDTIVPIKRIQPNALFQISQLALGAPKFEMIMIINDSDPCRVVAAIFELS